MREGGKKKERKNKGWKVGIARPLGRLAGGGKRGGGVEVRVCMQLACLASRCGEGGEVEGYKAPGCWDAVIRTSRRGLGAMVVRWSLGGPV